VSLRSQHVEGTRRAVLDAARAAFGAKGYAQASVDEIAAAAGVTKGAVYHHFTGKEALFRAVHAEVEADAMRRTARADDPAAAPLDRIVAQVNGYLDAALDPEIRRITLVDGPALLGLDPDIPGQQAAHDALRAFLTAAIADREIAELDPDVLAHLVAGLALQGGLIIARAGDPDAVRASLGPPLVFFAGALANGDLWRDVVAALEDRYRCITVDLPLGAHPWPLPEGADRSATSLARLLPDCLELLDVEDATIVVNDTAGGQLLLALGTGHAGLDRIGRLVLTNCESYDQFPPDALKKASAVGRRAPRVARAAVRFTAGGRRGLGKVTARGLDDERAESFFGPVGRDPRIADDLVAAMAGFRPQLLLDAAAAIPRFDRPVLLVWGDACEFFPLAHAQRLAADFPDATLVPMPGARTWVPVDDPAALAEAIAAFVPAAVA
jgi:AcrR family transcriptional regulator